MNNYREEVLNIHKKDEIKYRVEIERCQRYGIVHGNLIGYNIGYDKLEPYKNIIFNIPLPIGKWKIVDYNEKHTIKLLRK